MEVKDLFDPIVKQEIVDRINKLTSQTQSRWGKMNVSQMLAHVQMPIRIAFISPATPKDRTVHGRCSAVTTAASPRRCRSAAEPCSQIS